MALFKCKMCGGTLEINNQESVATCEYCGMQQTLPKLDDERRANLYDRANHFRRNNEFDKAMGIYEQILNEDGTDAEAYWSLVLCRYGIEYVEDPTSHKRMPTVNRAQFTSIYEDNNYKSALQYADGAQRQLYEEEAKTINEIQKGILAISQKEEPFDVFICYKESDNGGRRTPDSVLAQELYYQLKQEGFKVFFSRITLEDKIGSAYEPYIFAALNSAKVMVVLGTKPEHFNAAWVKNEWSRYLSLIKSGEKKTLIPAYRDMDPYDLPEEFSHLQAQDMSKLGFMQDLIRGITKIAEAELPRETATKETVVVNGVVNITPLLRRAFIFLEDGNWDEAEEYCEKVLDQDPENAEAYLGKLMAELHVCQREQLSDCRSTFDENDNYRKTIRFANEELKNEMLGYIEYINTRNENERLADRYEHIVHAMNMATTEDEYKSVAERFAEMGTYSEAARLAKECLEKAELAKLEALERAENVKKNEIYKYACQLKAKNTIWDLEQAIAKFKEIPSWRDSQELMYACEKRINEIKVEQERLRLEKERQEELARIEREKRIQKTKKFFKIATPIVIAMIVGMLVTVYYIIPTNKYNKAISLMEEGVYGDARSILVELDGFKSSENKLAVLDAIDTIEDGEYDAAIKGVLSASEVMNVKYNLNGGTSSGGDSFSYVNLSDYASLLTPQKEGYRFVGWELSGYSYSKDNSLELLLDAVWSDEYLISYNLDGGTANNPTEYRKVDKAITLTNPTKKGHTFLGWTGTDLTGLTMNVTIPEGSYGNREYTANWEAHGRITYNLNGGKATNISEYTFLDDDFTLNNPTKSGYTFLGWTGTDLTGLTMNVTIPKGSHGNREYTANWEAHGRITYNLNGGKATNISEYSFLDDDFTLNNPTREGYTFTGWTGTGLDGLTKTVTIPSGSHGNREFTANWKPNKYTITLNANGGTVSISSISADYKSAYDLPTPKRDYYTFAGWYNGTKKYEDGTWDKASNVTLTAKWTPVTYTITYNLSGGTNSSQNAKSFTVESSKITLKNPTKKGYKFVGWYKDSSYSSKVTQIAAKSHGDITLYAKWEIVNYTITYKMNGGTVSGTKKTTFTVNDLPLTLPTASKTDYVFLGWKKDDFNGADVAKITSCENITVYAAYMDAYLQLQLYEPYSWQTDKETYYIVSKYSGTATSVDIPSSYEGYPVREIKSSAFENNKTITTVNIPDSVTTIGSYAFSGCTSLKNIVIPQAVTAIESSTFKSCVSLKSIQLPNKLSRLGSYAFRDCTALSSINIPGTVKKLEYSTFYGCTNLAEVTLNEGLEEISYNVFTSPKLSKLIIPKSVIKIDSEAFEEGYSYGNTVKDCTNVVFFCRAAAMPSGWETGWNLGRPIIWGYSESAYNDPTYSFVTNGGSSVASVKQTLVSAAPESIKSGYVLVGWYDNANLSGEAVAFPYYSTSKTTLYAKWITEKEYYDGTSFDKAIEITQGISKRVTIDTAGEYVYCRITPTETRTYNINSYGGEDSVCYLYDSSRSQLTYDYAEWKGEFSFSHTLTAGFTYYIVVKMQYSFDTGSFIVFVY